MAKYDCEVKDSKGEILKTQLEAPNMQELAARLSDKGFYLVKATEVKKSAGKSLFGGGVKAKEMMVFTTQLSTLVGAAIPLVEAVGIMADQTTNPYFKGVLEAIGRDLQSGVLFPLQSVNTLKFSIESIVICVKLVKPAVCWIKFCKD